MGGEGVEKEGTEKLGHRVQRCWEIHGAHDNCAQKKIFFFLHPTKQQRKTRYIRENAWSLHTNITNLSHLHVLHVDFTFVRALALLRAVN